jgi:hypothetical protein
VLAAAASAALANALPPSASSSSAASSAASLNLVAAPSSLQGFGEGGRRLKILDARAKAAASANHARGAGYEGGRYAQIGCDIQFLNIENIHAMRDSLSKVFDLLKTNGGHIENYWLSALESTQWLKHIRQIILGAVVAVEVSESRSDT